MEITSIKYINLKKNEYRNAYMEQLLDSFTYQYERIPGVLVASGEFELEKYLTNGVDPNLGTLRKNGVIGCWIAHCHAIENIQHRKGITVVLEDDFTCTRDFFESALRQIDFLDFKYDMILFDTYGRGPLAIHRVQKRAYKVTNRPDGFYGGTHCVFINNEKIPKILAQIANSQITDYDKFLLSNTNLEIYVLYSGKCSIRDFGSDVTPRTTETFSFQPPGNRILQFHTTPAIQKNGIDILKEVKETLINTNNVSQMIGYYLVPGFKTIHIEIKIRDNFLIMRQEWNNTEIQFNQLSDGTFYNKEFSIPLEFSQDTTGSHIAIIHFTEVYKKNENHDCGVLSKIPNIKIFEGIYSENGTHVAEIYSIDQHIVLNIFSSGVSIPFIHHMELEFYGIGDDSFPIRFTTNTQKEIDNLIIFNRIIFKKVHN